MGASLRLEVQRVSGEGHVPLARRNRLGSAWLPLIEPVGVMAVRDYPLKAGAGGEASSVVELEDLPVGGAFGTYALTVQSGEGSLHFVGTVARVMRPHVQSAISGGFRVVCLSFQSALLAGGQGAVVGFGELE